MAANWNDGVQAWIASIDLIGFSNLERLEDMTAWRTSLCNAARRGLLLKDREDVWPTFVGDEIRVAFDASAIDFNEIVTWTEAALKQLAKLPRTPKPEARAFIIGPGQVIGEELDTPRARYLDGPLAVKVDAWGGCKPKLEAWHIAASEDLGPGAEQRTFGEELGWVLKCL
jgi:hypothetical protein